MHVARNGSLHRLVVLLKCIDPLVVKGRLFSECVYMYLMQLHTLFTQPLFFSGLPTPIQSKTPFTQFSAPITPIHSCRQFFF